MPTINIGVNNNANLNIISSINIGVNNNVNHQYRGEQQSQPRYRGEQSINLNIGLNNNKILNHRQYQHACTATQKKVGIDL